MYWMYIPETEPNSILMSHSKELSSGYFNFKEFRKDNKNLIANKITKKKLLFWVSMNFFQSGSERSRGPYIITDQQCNVMQCKLH